MSRKRQRVRVLFADDADTTPPAEGYALCTGLDKAVRRCWWQLVNVESDHGRAYAWMQDSSPSEARAVVFVERAVFVTPRGVEL